MATQAGSDREQREGQAAADEFCRDQSLLTMPATPQQLALLDWYVGEFVRQGAGEEPQPWTGSTTVERQSSS